MVKAIEIVYLKETLKYGVQHRICKRIGRVHTGMQQVLMLLKARGFMVENPEAIEMFGAFGLWHTKDYICDVKALDFLDIESDYVKKAKGALKGFPVSFIVGDSIQYIRHVQKKYDFIVCDYPYHSGLWDDTGLPLFFDDMVNIANRNATIIFNLRNEFLPAFLSKNPRLTQYRTVFFVARNALISYAVVCL